jgi:hypothetical protein
MPGIVVLTAGCSRMNLSANSGRSMPAGQEQSLNAVECVCQRLRREIAVAPVAVRPARIARQRSRETSLVERHARDHRMFWHSQYGNRSSSGAWSKMLYTT